MSVELDARMMARAFVLAERGEGWVEPNPMVGCVIAQGESIVGEGWHQRFGGPHAEVEALRSAGDAANGATLYVTLEPCCHHGKTPPCTEAICAAGIGRVVAAQRDPFPRVAGGGIRQLSAAGIPVETGLLESQAKSLNAPYLKLISRGRPWVLAKWAMTLDGKLGSRQRDSQWISGEASRAIVHQLRGRMDAILAGSGTTQADDPLLTARPAGPRVAVRVVLDSRALLRSDSRLVKSAHEIPVLVVVGADAVPDDVTRLREAGCETLLVEGDSPAQRFTQLLDELGRRRYTNILIEGGGELHGAAVDAGEVDEVHVFIAPRVIGGRAAVAAVAGEGIARMSDAIRLVNPCYEVVEQDVYVHGRIDRE